MDVWLVIWAAWILIGPQPLAEPRIVLHMAPQVFKNAFIYFEDYMHFLMWPSQEYVFYVVAPRGEEFLGPTLATAIKRSDWPPWNRKHLWDLNEVKLKKCTLGNLLLF